MRVLSSIILCAFLSNGCAGFQLDSNARKSLIDVVNTATPMIADLDPKHARRINQALVMLDFFVEELENSHVSSDYVSATTDVLEKLSDEIEKDGELPDAVKIIIDALVVVGATIQALQ